VFVGYPLGTTVGRLRDRNAKSILNDKGTVDVEIIEEKTYTKDEVLTLLQKAWLGGSLQQANPLKEQGYTSFIKENLK